MSLYYFTFELFWIKGTLEAEIEADFKKTKQKIKISKAVSFSFLIINAIILSAILFLITKMDKKTQDISKLLINETSIVIVDSINTVTKIIIDFIMNWQFIKLLRYFVGIKYKISVQLGVKFTVFNRFVVLWTIFLWILCVYQSVTSVQTTVYLHIEQDYFNSNYQYNYASFMFFIIFPVRDFFIAISFAYLYYYQGMKNK